MWEDHRLIPGAWLAASSEAHHVLINSAEYIKVRGRHKPPTSSSSSSCTWLLSRPFHLARCMLTAGQGPGLTNRTQISASHLPQGSSLELILASAAPEWCLSV